MEKANDYTKDLVARATRSAMVLGFENLVIDEFGVRGISTSENTFIFSKIDNDNFDLKKIAIADVQAFDKRLSMFPEYSLNFSLRETPTTTFCLELLLKPLKGKSKVQFKCANPVIYQSLPKRQPDVNHYEITLTNEDINTLVKSFSVMRSNSINFDLATSTILLKDIVDGVFSHELEIPVATLHENANKNAKFMYKADRFLKMLKENSSNTFMVTSTGMVLMNINGIDCYIASHQE